MFRKTLTSILCAVGIIILAAGCGQNGSAGPQAGMGLGTTGEEGVHMSAEALLREKYQLTDDELSGIDADALVADYRMDEMDYTKEEVLEIIEDQREYYEDDPTAEIFSILGNTDEVPADSADFSETSTVTRVAYYANPGSAQKRVLFDLKNKMYYVDDGTMYYLDEYRCSQLVETLRNAGVSWWKHYYEDAAEQETTGSFAWKLVIEQENGPTCSYGGYTKDMSTLPQGFSDVDGLFTEITENR